MSGTVQLKFLVKVPMSYGANEPATETRADWPRYLRTSDFDERGVLRHDTFRSLHPSLADSCIVHSGDLLLTRSGSVGRVFMVPWGLDDACHAGYLVKCSINPSVADNRFVHYCLLSKTFLHWISQNQIQATIQNVNARKFGNYPVPLLSPHQASDIADYLDYETEQIDEFIADQEQLIELLTERRQTKIDRAYLRTTTRTPLKRYLRQALQYGANEPALETRRDWPRYLRITDFGLNGDLKDESFRSLNPDIALHYPLDAGDLLLARSGATVGKSFLVPAEQKTSCYAGYLIRCSVRHDRLLPEYLYGFMQTTEYWDWVQQSQIVATIQNVSAEKYSHLPIPTPPVEEQERIVAELDRELGEIDEMIADGKLAVELSKEKRAALITAAVTDEIDVSDWQRPDGWLPPHERPVEPVELQ